MLVWSPSGYRLPLQPAFLGHGCRRKVWWHAGCTLRTRKAERRALPPLLDFGAVWIEALQRLASSNFCRRRDGRGSARVPEGATAAEAGARDQIRNHFQELCPTDRF